MDKILTELVTKRDGLLCHYCGVKTTTKNRQIDHVHPQAKGGKDELSNLRCSCQNCNRAKSARDVEEFISSEYVQTTRKLKRLQFLIDNPDEIYPKNTVL